MITQQEIKRVFHYDPEEGVLSWRIPVANGKRKPGDEAGTLYYNQDNKPYKRVMLQRKQYFVHRIIWLYVHGYFPEQIDHKDGNGTNNRLANLREVNNVENNKNRRKPKTNTSGICGVYWSRARGKWVAHIRINGRKKNLGGFSDKEEAVQTRKTAEAQHGYHPNHGTERPL